MKNKILMAVAACLFSTGVAMAQYVDTENYTRVQASYVSHNLTNDYNDQILPKGVTAGILHGFSLSDELPIFLELGADLTWAHSVKDNNPLDITYKFTYMNVAVPLNGVYKFTLNDKVAFSGHAGLNFKVNFMAKIHEGKNDWSFLSKDDMGSRDDRANIFQLGGQLGAGVHLGQIYLGWQYQGDFMKFVELGNDKCKWHTNYITVGYTL